MYTDDATERLDETRGPVKRIDPANRIMIDAKEAAVLFTVSVRTWRSHDAAGKIPRATRLGRRTLWLVSELKTWAEAGCPDRVTWNQTKNAVFRQKVS